MPELNFRLTSSEDFASIVINQISSLEGVESAEEIADLMPHMDDPDSSSRGLPDDIGPGTHLIRVQASNDTVIRRVMQVAEASAHDEGAAFEVVDNHER